jgi:hypothetical protein
MSALPPNADIKRDGWHLRLVPKGDICVAANTAPYSITSSARNRIEVETSRPSALAVLRFNTTSNLVGSMTGKSAGFSPFRTRPV